MTLGSVGEENNCDHRDGSKRAPDTYRDTRHSTQWRFLMGLSRIDPQRLRAGGHAFDAITLRCRKCNMSRREWDQSGGKAKCQGEAAGRELKRREAKK